MSSRAEKEQFQFSEMRISVQHLSQLVFSPSRRHGNESFFKSFLGYFVKLFRAFHKNRSFKIFIRYLISENFFIFFIWSDPLLQFLHIKIFLGPKRSTKSSQAPLGALSLISFNQNYCSFWYHFKRTSSSLDFKWSAKKFYLSAMFTVESLQNMPSISWSENFDSVR